MQPISKHPTELVARPVESLFEEREEQLDLRRYWRTISKHKWGILALVLLVGIGASIYALSLEPVYRATATLLIEAKPTKYVSIQDVYESYYQTAQYYETQYQILQSRALAESVVDHVELWKHPALDPTQTPESRAPLQIDWRKWLPTDWLPPQQRPRPLSEGALKARALRAVMGGTSVEPVKGSQLVRISFQASDPDLAATGANAVADGYIESILEARFQMAQKASTWLSERLQTLRDKLDASEKSLQEYRDREGLVDVSGVKTLAVSDLDTVRGRLEEARKRRSELAALQAKVGSGRMASAAAAVANPAVEQLKEAEIAAQQELAQLSKRYGPEHPKMIAANTRLEAVRNELKDQVSAAAGGIGEEYRLALKIERELEGQVEQAKEKVQAINRKEFELQKLERDVEANRQLYDMFLTRFKETNVGGSDSELANARIVDAATIPGAPYEPNVQRIVLLALLIALMAGIGIAFLVERLDNTLKGSDDVEDKLQLPVLGLVPALRIKGKGSSSPQRMFLDESQSQFSETIRTLRTSVLLSGLDSPHKLVLVTSSIIGEGKTTVAMNLAFALGHLEKVLLIDADMRRPSMGEQCGFGRDAPGLSNLIAGTASPSECIHKLPDSHVHVLPAGIVPPNPLELLSSQRLAAALEKLGQAYDRIVVDSAPTQAVSDPLVLSRYSNAVIYVVQADSTPYQVAQLGIKRLRQVDAPVIGIVLNRVEVQKSGKYGKYGYYGDYYAHYGYRYRKAS